MHGRVICFVLLFVPGAASGGTIVLENLVTENYAHEFGEREPAVPYYAQTFVAVGDRLKEATIPVLINYNSGPDSTDFRVLITDTIPGDSRFTNASFVPKTVLFESGTLSAPFTRTSFGDPLQFREFTVDIGALPLRRNETYALVMDAFIAFDGLPGSTGVGINFDDYLQGDFVYYGYAERERQQVFSAEAQWSQEPCDLAFRLEFVSEPASLALFAIAFAGVVASRRRRK